MQTTYTLKQNAPIGIFDSGIGGLTVVKAVREALPGEHVIYFGDTARVPYGIKSAQTITEYALQITDFLLARQVKMILIACNSVAATARQAIRAYAPHLPVLDVLEAGVQAARQQVPANASIGVIGTLATIASEAYTRALVSNGFRPDVRTKACPLLVPLAEEGWTNNEVALRVLRHYLHEFTEDRLDALILGCTHYPLFADAIAEILGPEPVIIDSAAAIVAMTLEKLREQHMLGAADNGHFECHVSDEPQRFREVAERFLGQELAHVTITNPGR